MSFTLPNAQLASTPSRNLSPSIPFRQCRNRTLGDRRGRKRPGVTVRCNIFHSPSPFRSLFDNLIVQFPFVNSLDVIAPALGLASGAALYLARFRGDSNVRRVPQEGSVSEIGEWVLMTSPTPFNRFVMLRCPSVSFMGGELLENLNESLMREQSHFVRLFSGRIQVGMGEEKFDEKLVYQRLCINMEDGGVVSLDWPANLDLEECGLDTTLVIVPGTAEGSMDEDIRAFVCQCLRRGCFPVVMNPRGCAGSPLTTARLFTAADSDDISTTIEFIKKRRPWSTLMGIGWGYGANMLTKYLAEAEGETPLMAATCVDNPFDLEEATRASSHLNQKLTPGLVNILQSNMELFQGRKKGFNVEKALLSTCIRDFEKEISTVSHGYNSIEDFYAKSSTRDLIGRVKIPLLFIQNNDRSVPLFSVPQSSIAQNPFTSQLLCNHFLFTESIRDRSTISWCQNLAMEWMAAVELGLLKGHHPLLQDLDVTINPSSVPAMLMRSPDASARVKKNLTLQSLDSSDGHILEPFEKTFVERNTAASQNTGLLLHEDNDKLVSGRSVADSGEEEAMGHDDDDRVRMIQAAQVVMNMLDVTMSDAFTEEQKKKVLTAVDQGETLMNALQGAVPEDVRGKLTNTVSDFVNNQGSDLKLDRLLALKPIPYVTSRSNSTIQENIKGDSSLEAENESSYTSDEVKAGDFPNGSNKHAYSADNHSGIHEAEWRTSEDWKRSDNTCQSPSNNFSDMETKEMSDLLHKDDDANIPDKTGLDFSNRENESKTGEKTKSSSVSERESANENMDSEKYKMQDGAKIEMDFNGESSSQTKEENVGQSSSYQNSTKPKIVEKEISPATPSETQVMEKMDGDYMKREEKGMQTHSNQSLPNSPVFSASQALDALTGIDDSTQVAVNSVFHVLEDMITRLEDGKNADNKTGNRDNNGLDEIEGKNKYAGTPPSDAIPSNNQSRSKKKMKEKHMILGESVSDMKHSAEKNEGKRQEVFNAKLSVEDSAKYLNTVSQNVPFYTIKGCLGSSVYKEKEAISKSLHTTKVLYTENDANSDNNVASHEGWYLRPRSKDINNELSYAVLDSEKWHETIEKSNGYIKVGDEKLEKPSDSIRSIIMDTLKVEVGRRLSSADMERMETELSRDLEHIANVVSQGIGFDGTLALNTKLKDCDSEKVGTLHAEHVVKVISSAVQNTSYLQRVLPVGVIVGSLLAALGKSSTVQNYGKGNDMIIDQINKNPKDEKGSDIAPNLNTNQKNELESPGLMIGRRVDSENMTKVTKPGIASREDSGDSSKSIMVGAVTAALGASALLTHHQDEETEISSNHSGKDVNKNTITLEDVDKPQDNVVTSLAEKAMSIASPVVPTKDGEVDQERLVAMLAELGQKGGVLRFIGKFALLWGGLRGAMSLTDKLISFLRVAERPFFQRILAFICMVLVLWSPVVIPLLPTLVHSWTTQNPSKTAELICIFGLYISIVLLVTLWGKRIRGYQNPLELYGLDLTSLLKVQNFLKGLVGGIILVILIYSVNSLLGCVHFQMPITLSSSPSAALSSLKVFSQMAILAFQGVITATGVAIVEELLFRSWLSDEIASELGYSRGIIISGLAFSVFQRSAWAVPGLWMLSLALSGLRKRNQGSLSLTIGVRTGILACNNFLKMGGFLVSESKFPPWFTGAYSFQPFSGATGLAFALLLALIVYSQEIQRKCLEP
ncbi:unnamed protein product [Cuscuta epithymum]|uniref:Embryogenesis-associated protein EMB8 n=1 Tax=Cuscuta epithymum TaxID=186058 RepID=A0AAV0E591_9ASTE|nr:unnamed protein product [Cuscuta epithymum]